MNPTDSLPQQPTSPSAHPTREPREPLEGIVPPLVTPLAARDKLDEPGLERLLEHVLSGGVNGVFILGTSGEAPSLSHRLQQEMVKRTCALLRSRLPVLVGITDTALTEALNLARVAADAGAQAVVASAPYYFAPGQPELADFIEELVRDLPLPLYLYNMPEMTKVQFEPETLRRLAQCDNIIGVKDSSGSLDYFRQLVQVAKQRPDWRLFMGPEHLLLEALRLGGHGGVNGGAQIDPTLLEGLYRAARAGNDPETLRLQARLERLQPIYSVGNYASTVIKGMKCALSLMGICQPTMAAPFSPFTGSDRERVRNVLLDLRLIS